MVDDPPLTRTCKKCGELKPLSDFELSSLCKYGRTHRCRACSNVCKRAFASQPEQRVAQRGRNKRWREINPTYMSEYARRLRDVKRQIVLDAKRDQPCVDCGGIFPSVAMDFDHVIGDKVLCVAKLANDGSSPDRVRVEIEKCVLRCANCHRIRHLKDWA